MDQEQIWAQVELRSRNVCEILEYALEGTGELPEEDEELDMEGKNVLKRELAQFGDDEEFDGMDIDEEEEDGESDEEDESEDEDENEQDSNEDEETEGEPQENVGKLRDPSDEEDELDLDAPSSRGNAPRSRRAKKGKSHELDDGFFNLAAFNAQTEEAEARAVSKGRLDDDDDEEGAEDEMLDIYASMGNDEEVDDTQESQELFYKDFFAPPSHRDAKKLPQPTSSSPKKPGVRFHEEVRIRNIKAKGKSLPMSALYDLGEDEDDDDSFGEKMLEDEEESEEGESADDDDQELGNMEDDESEDEMDEDLEMDEDGFETRETIDRFKDDLFAEEGELETGLSTYEKRMESLQEEISQLESENVGQKHWTLMGEATSRTRPQNALLEEDLEFERVMKTVPVITEDVVQGLEERIKARIQDSQFDDVVRKRPVDDKPFLPSRFFELQDTKSKQSLAEIYEDEYTAAKTGGPAGEDRDGKLKKEHDEINKLWENICSRLDALSNAHFTPKAPKASISTIANVSTATLESALPTTKATTTMLAPEEVFAPSNNALRARSELTPIEKRALRNKEKKAKKKARDTLEKSVDTYAKMRGIRGVKKQKEAALKSIVKGGKGVTVIGKKSKDVVGKKPRS
ncbi:hypothetical protein EW026_g20 [Hermanssonia centrifuga]|uniref:U3 small nucleolar ribonucleoprotein protein MPP10 n=1 Tax=Hermanssonia centrifuga TaxID=98765 RepID=A0A4V3XBP6_9APHY|nr:hypothetical protein EW026_g20 [Hermanssonia centrifuga]